jgi:hypothetical protein
MTSPLSNPRDLRYSSADHSTVDCVVTHEVYGDIPFTASSRDVEAYGRQLFEGIVAGEYGEVADYAPPSGASLLARNLAERTRRTEQAAMLAFPLQCAVAQGMASDVQQQRLTELQQYVVSLDALEMQVADVSWPELPN